MIKFLFSFHLLFHLVHKLLNTPLFAQILADLVRNPSADLLGILLHAFDVGIVNQLRVFQLLVGGKEQLKGFFELG